MAVGVACSGTLRWRALGRATDILCSLHHQQLATPLGLSTHHARRLRPSPSYPPSTGRRNRLSSRKLRCTPSVATAAGHHVALLAAMTANSSTSAPTAAAAAATAAAAAALPPALVAFVSLLPSIGTFLLCLAAATFLIASVPAVWALARMVSRAERLLAVLEAELPDTASSLRLAGLEVTDCIQELGSLGGELTHGVRSTAALATAAEAGVRGGVAVADSALRNHVVPAMAKAERHARGAAEEHLAATAKLSYTAPVVSQAAAATAVAVRRLRAGLAVGQLASAAVQAGRSARDALVLQHQQLLESDPSVQRRLQEEEALREQLEALRAKQRQQQDRDLGQQQDSERGQRRQG